jgi:hypothetical protein
LHRGAFQRSQHADPCIVDQSIDRPCGLHCLTDAVRVSDVEGKYTQTFGARHRVFARRTHRGDDLPVAIEEISGGFEAKAGRASGDQDGFHWDTL